MADQFRYKLMTDLTAKDAPSDTDLVAVGNNGSSALRKLTFASIANAIKTKLLTWTFSNLTTSKKNLPEAINELNSKITNTQILTFKNANKIEFTIPQVPDASHFGQILLINTNQESVLLFSIDSNPKVVNVFVTSKTFQYSISGTKVTITPSSTLWGMTTLIVTFN